MLIVPQHLEGHISQLIATDQITAMRKQFWAVILGLTPKLDGNQYFFLWGENLQSGIAGFGESVTAAIEDFEKNMFQTTTLPKEKCPLCADPTHLPSHNGSKNCESGSIASGGTKCHCTCDICF